MQSALKLASRPDVNINRGPQTPQSVIGAGWAKELRWGIVRHDQQDIVVAVGAGFAACHRAEEVDALRMVCRDKPLDYLRKELVRFGSC